jgi:hypothetical protein
VNGLWFWVSGLTVSGLGFRVLPEGVVVLYDRFRLSGFRSDGFRV